jgi:hypothetical protein
LAASAYLAALAGATVAGMGKPAAVVIGKPPEYIAWPTLLIDGGGVVLGPTVLGSLAAL